jgi:hypothetical protein
LWKHFESDEGYKNFIAKFRQWKEYANIEDRHVVLLWRAIHESPKHTLHSAIEKHASADLFWGLVHSHQRTSIYKHIQSNLSVYPYSPIASILLGRWRDPEEYKDRHFSV